MAHRLIAPINLLEEVRLTQIIVPNPTKLTAKLARFIQDGASNLQVVSDFDQTFTRYSLDGRKFCTTYGAMQTVLSAEQLEECSKLYDHYHPIEVDSTIPYKAKYEYMDEWLNESNRIMMKVPFHINDLKRVVDSGVLMLRHGVDAFMTLCEEQSIKFTVVSAGLGNLIQLCLDEVPSGHIAEVFANYIVFGADGMSTHFKEPWLHSLSKPTILANEPLRKNILLLGDMPHDLLMVGLHDQENLLSIGYFNDPHKYNIEDYKEKFDVLCLRDGNLEVAEVLAAWICGVDRSVDESPSLHSLLGYKLA